ncbi:hypothetical protein [Rhizobium ruizarguesonis]|uniref:hypothetical protein n=1 Tax=Rhizobium ruizarguesonis TaxID=2081791 RepID=UPI00102F4DF6|nr:hypothetical protein [Rhizobium ruizarguesonis]TAY79719.1 hypothetical protein ELH86_12550 [Rhizobium ruizarguesonis]TBD21830.1 hypothetical protein ELH23_13535 [Rhizobium ruizarguesonis]
MPSAFETALTAGNLNAIRACPKSDLHNHALLGGNRQFVEARTGRNVEPLHGGNDEADARLGQAAWTVTTQVLQS